VVDVVFTGSSTIDTDTGEVTIGGVVTEVPNEVANGIRIYMFKAIDVQGTVKVTGTLPIALVAHDDVVITGALDVSGDGLAAGPGAIASGECDGESIIGGTSFPGGGGAGRFEAGGSGGSAYGGPTGGVAGISLSDSDLQPLRGGCRGGEARGLVSPTPPPNGGGGGGAVQVVSRNRIEFTSTGIIDASGGGGSGNTAGPGGGSGGGVLLEAPAIVLDGPGVIISTKGGAGGGAGGTVAAGEDGGTSASPAAGGSRSGYATGGDGGTELVPPGNGASGNATNGQGAGGGGSVGEARFNSSSATVVPANGAAIRSRFTTGTLATRLIP
jgi:hypothetical protein